MMDISTPANRQEESRTKLKNRNENGSCGCKWKATFSTSAACQVGQSRNKWVTRGSVVIHQLSPSYSGAASLKLSQIVVIFFSANKL